MVKKIQSKVKTAKMLLLFQMLTSAARRPLFVTKMQNATILAARIVVLVTQDSLVTGKLAKVSENGSAINKFTKTTKSCF